MSLSRVVFRDALKESEVQRYWEVDLDTPPSIGAEVGESTTAVDQELPLLASSPEAILAAAQESVAALLEEARQQAEIMRQEASNQGFAQGLAEGRDEARKALSLSLVAVAQAGQSLIVLEEQLVARFTPQLVRLALEIAEKVVAKQVAEDPLIIASILERARTEIPQARLVRIWLHPADHQLLQELRPELVWTGEKGGRKVEVLTSDEIEQGGCRVETEMGIVDATIPVQMQELRRQLLDEEL
jgi:flagellar assembly protein FliH